MPRIKFADNYVFFIHQKIMRFALKILITDARGVIGSKLVDAFDGSKASWICPRVSTRGIRLHSPRRTGRIRQRQDRLG